MTATKKEAQAALNAARTKAQNAAVAASEAAMTVSLIGGFNVDADAAEIYYRRCVAEFEEAINDYARFDTSSDDES